MLPFYNNIKISIENLQKISFLINLNDCLAYKITDIWDVNKMQLLYISSDCPNKNLEYVRP